ncbi:MAG: bifunctional diaminohydroxyphosphoribosylaminopyrimidine deaminase/5-amino-6-(5-phosphoribosylamino)uracil reductase RibD [Chlamydiia bacterium]|nr:bifunctional diaminohydroxyphosphoribosylaminopyrimidine deaminase/5-amino-6-(5-phosphoribosylamino)uracil reductase RibD [Chlamydiia bacterium]
MREQQEFFMQWAIKEGEKGRATAPPNPWVGCLIVKEGEVLGKGFHEAPGQPHAERIALQQAGIDAKGATAYITLEPCAHHGRTPPCADALIKSGIRTLVIPLLDPDLSVAGKGVKALKEAGIEVIIGVCKEEAEKSLGPYLFHRRNGIPYTVLKIASSLDGKVAAVDGTSKWITDEAARQDVHRLRSESGALLIGAYTAQKDLPYLTVRHGEQNTHPLRVVVDSKGIVPPKGPLFDPSLGRTVIFTLTGCAMIPEWERMGVEVVPINGTLEGVDIKTVLEKLGQRGVLQLLVEGGATLVSNMIEGGCYQRLVVYYGGCLIGSNGLAFFQSEKQRTITDRLNVKLESISRFDNDIRLDYRPNS